MNISKPQVQDACRGPITYSKIKISRAEIHCKKWMGRNRQTDVIYCRLLILYTNVQKMRGTTRNNLISFILSVCMKLITEASFNF